MIDLRCTLMLIPMFISSINCLLPNDMSDEEKCAHTKPSSYPPSQKLIQDNREYSIATSTEKYILSEPFEANITGPDIQGLLLQARNSTTGELAGRFTMVVPDMEHAFISCQIVNDTAVVWFSRPQQHVAVAWINNVDKGSLKFLATVFRSDGLVVTNITSSTFWKGFPPIILDECGQTKGCFRYSKEQGTDCSADTCDYVITYYREGPNASFEMSAKADWVGIGFSSDDKMGGDDVYICQRFGDIGKVFQYANEQSYQTPKRQDSGGLFDAEADVNHQRIWCRFKRLLKAEGTSQYTVDLNNDWYQLYAWGPVSSSGTITRHELESPPTSERKLTLSTARNAFSPASHPQPPGGATSYRIFLYIAFSMFLCMAVYTRGL